MSFSVVLPRYRLSWNAYVQSALGVVPRSSHISLTSKQLQHRADAVGCGKDPHIAFTMFDLAPEPVELDFRDCFGFLDDSPHEIARPSAPRTCPAIHAELPN